MKYRKKPVIIEAMQFTNESHQTILDWISPLGFADLDESKNPILKIFTLEGTMTAILTDYIIKGVNGEFYPCKEEIFNKTYEKIND